MFFDVFPLRLDFTARSAIYFAPGKAANILRGAFGLALRRIAAPADYERIFEPPAAGPSGLAEPPRPFAFRTRGLDGRTIRSGEPFHFHLNLFTLDRHIRELVIGAFSAAAAEGFGPGRGAAELAGAGGEPLPVDLSPRSGGSGQVRVDFVTATELKHEQRVAERPEFAILFSRARDRVAALRALYGAGPIAVDFAALGERSRLVRMPRCEIRPVAVERRSSRTGQTHPLGGFTGFAEYEGALDEFLPWLEAARHTGVGRQAVWGKGEIEITPL